MTLSIRHMNYTLARREQEGSMAMLPGNGEQLHYWWIERESKVRANQWIFVKDFIGTKKEVAELWRRHYRNSQYGKFRLRHKLAYSH